MPCLVMPVLVKVRLGLYLIVVSVCRVVRDIRVYYGMPARSVLIKETFSAAVESSLLCRDIKTLEV